MRGICFTAGTRSRGGRIFSTPLDALISASRRLGVSAIIFLLAAAGAYGQLAIKGNTVWTMAGDPITNGVVLVKDGKIEAVGPASSVSIPEGYRVINAQFVTHRKTERHLRVGTAERLRAVWFID